MTERTKRHQIVQLVCLITLIALTALVTGCNSQQLGSSAKQPKVLFDTNMGRIVLQLDKKAAPKTVKNFLQYVNEGFYDNTIIHRVIQGFVIQGGGYSLGMRSKKVTHSPVDNEFKLSNVRGTIAMAKRPGKPDSATSQFFINLVDNSKKLDTNNGGFTVFGRVIEGMDVVDEIAGVGTVSQMVDVHGAKIEMRDIPFKDIIIKSARVIQ